MRTILFILAGTLAGGGILLAGAYLYLMHAPVPVSPTTAGTIHRGSLRVDERERTYVAYVPAEPAEHPALVLAFHGSRGEGETMRIFTGFEFERLADRYGFIVVYPDGFERHWNDCRKSGPYTANTLDVDDLGFTRALVERFSAEYGVDTGRVFAVGFSNGGHMAYRLALEMPEAVRAVAAVGASLPTRDNMDCTPSGQPVSVLILNGTADPISPFGGGTVSIYGFGDRGTVLASDATVLYFARLAGPLARPSPVPISGEGTRAPVERTTWTGGDTVEVSLYAVREGGHTVPQSRFRFPRLLGRMVTSVNGPAEIWHFFARQIPASRSEPRARRDTVRQAAGSTSIR